MRKDKNLLFRIPPLKPYVGKTEWRLLSLLHTLKTWTGDSQRTEESSTSNAAAMMDAFTESVCQHTRTPLTLCHKSFWYRYKMNLLFRS